MSGVRSISAAFAVLRLLGEGGALTLSDVARATGLSPSSALAILRTLVSEGALVRRLGDKRYELAAEWQVGSPFVVSQGQAAIDRLRPFMQEIGREFEATVGLWRVAAGRRLNLVAHVESEAPMRIHMAPGQRQPLGGGVVGRMHSAAEGTPEAELTRRFAETRWQQPITLARYLAEVHEAAARGFAIDDGVLHAGICSLCAALPAPWTGYYVSLSLFAGSRPADEVLHTGAALAARCRALASSQPMKQSA